jgi:uncharacterized protein (DUF433 family)
VTTKPTPTSLLDRVMYTYADADRHLGLHWGTSRRWLNGYSRSGTRYEPVLREEPSGSDAVTWGEFVETRLLSEFRDHGVSLQRLRPAVQQLREEFGRYPLAHARPFLDVEGRELVLRIQDEVGVPEELRFVVVRNGQGMITSPVKRFVEVVDFADEGTAMRILPGGRGSTVVIDPQRQSGRPVVRSVPTDVVLEQFNAGESITAISDLWELTATEIESALRFELTSRAA